MIHVEKSILLGVECYHFWHANDKNGFLSNLYHSPILVDNEYWDTSEHLYQADKHIDVIVRKKIQRQKKPLKSKFVSRKACKRLNRWA